MKIKILESFQTENSYYHDNLAVGWNEHTTKPINDIDNFHFFKFLTIDKDTNIEGRNIFPIFISAHTKQITKTDIGPILRYIKNNVDLFISKNLIPVFWDPLEGNVTIAEEIDKIADEFNSAFPIYYISADFKLTYRKNKFTFVYNDQWLHHIPPRNDIIDFIPERTYINCNRVARYHRCMLMDEIINRSMLTQGWNTWANTYGAFEEYKNDFPDTQIDQKKYDILDVKDITQANPTHMIPIRHCQSSTIYVNTETHYKNENLFISEKTYKPISIGMPFMSLGNPGTLDYLRLLGFETFSEWIDESYDLDLPLQKRVETLVENLVYLNGFSVKGRKKLRKSMSEVCRHNLEVYKRLPRRNTFVTNLKRIEKGML